MSDTKYQIFISSTYTDLIQARQKIIEAILNLYHFPVGMEMFSAGDEEQWEIIKDTIKDSDYYILIVGHRYGSETHEGISYTEKEYDYAASQGIPILSFIRKRDVPTKADEREDDPLKNEKLNQFIKKAETRMCEYWENTDELAHKVTAALTKIFKRRPRTGWIKAENSIQELSKEITELSKENRRLREENQILIEKLSQIDETQPSMEILLNGDSYLELNYSRDIKYASISPNKILLEEIPAHLLPYITEEQINEYNEALPVEAIKKYNKELEHYIRLSETSTDLSITIYNNGTSKATQTYIDIIFPAEVMVMKTDELEDLKAPEKPNMPKNPMKIAKQKYEEKITGSLNKFIGSQMFHPAISLAKPSYLSSSKISKLLNPNSNTFSWVEDNKITIKIKNLIHTRQITIDEEYSIIPLKVGEFEIEVSVICEEYTEPKEFTIPLTIKETNQ